MSNPIETALAVATRQWHDAHRTFEQASRAFADAQTQLQHAERDLHELARAIELVHANPLIPTTVTMPIVAPPGGPAIGTVPDDGLDAAEIVRQEMMRMRMGSP